MKNYQVMAPMGVFSLGQAIEAIGNESNAKKALSNMVRNKQVRRVKKNLYSIVDPVTQDDSMSRFVIASHVTEDSFIGLHSAFEFYGFYNQIYYEIQILSTKRFLDFQYRDYSYRYFLSKSLTQIEMIQGVRVSSIERTVVDSINLLGKAMDAEELVKCLSLVHRVNTEKVKEMLLEYDKDLLYRKVGYVLSFFKEDFNLTDDFFLFCKEKSNVLNYGYLLYSDTRKLEFIKEWGIYAYKDLKRLSGKGVPFVI